MGEIVVQSCSCFFTPSHSLYCLPLSPQSYRFAKLHMACRLPEQTSAATTVWALTKCTFWFSAASSEQYRGGMRWGRLSAIYLVRLFGAMKNVEKARRMWRWRISLNIHSGKVPNINISHNNLLHGQNTECASGPAPEWPFTSLQMNHRHPQVPQKVPPGASRPWKEAPLTVIKDSNNKNAHKAEKSPTYLGLSGIRGWKADPVLRNSGTWKRQAYQSFNKSPLFL